MALVKRSARPRRRAVALLLNFVVAIVVQAVSSFAQPVYDGYAPDGYSPEFHGPEYDWGPAGCDFGPEFDCGPEFSTCYSEPPRQNGCFGGGGAWFGAEWLRWRIEGGDKLPPLVTDAPADSPYPIPGALGNPDTRILYGDQTVGEDWRSGFRLYAGVWLDGCQSCGIVGDYFDTDNDGDFFISDPDSGRIVTRPFLDAEIGQNSAEGVDESDELEGTVMVSSGDDFSGAGIAATRRIWKCCDPCGCGPSSQVYMLGGYRYYKYDTDLVITEDLLILPNTSTGFVPGTTIFLQDKFFTENEFHGGEIGVQGMMQRSCWWVDGLFKVAAGWHRRVVTIDGETTFDIPINGNGDVQTFGGGLLTSEATNIGRYANNTMAVIPELRVGVGSQLTCNISVRAGYGVIFWNAVARAGSQLPPQLEVDTRNQPPILTAGGPEPEFDGIRGTSLVAHGFDLGIQLTY